MRNQKGITLVALIITVIILLILATVSISLIINSGIINKAKYGVDRYSEEEHKEKIDFEEYEKTLKNYANEKYVQEGLVLYYDGINNTRNGNNPNATVWEDLSGNENDGIYSNAMVANQNEITDLSKGYYSPEEKGYVFLQNDAYIKSKNNIGISGDANFTVEVVMKPWKDRKNPNYSCYSAANPVWWGTSNPDVGRSVYFPYSRSSGKVYIGFVNNTIVADKGYDIINRTSYLSYSKIRNGVIKNGDKDVAKMNYNGSLVSSTYTGSAKFTQNLVDSPIEVGRQWQYNNQNRPFYGSIQCIRIYNRVLTDEEVAHNYELDKSRFNIE